MQNILVKMLMSEQIISLPQDTCIRSVLDQMTVKNYSCVIIVENQRPVGIITERDIVRMLQSSEDPANLYQLSVARVMSSPITSLNQNQSLFDALVISRANNIRHFPVVDDTDKLVGLVTTSDLANAHFHVIEKQSEIIQQSVALKTKELAKANEELLALSLMDHLTGIGNRRAMEVDLRHTHAAAQRYRQIYSVILMDLDYFKLFNDHYGHGAGDEALQAVANHIKVSIRKSDRLYRYGGEEILLLLPSTDVSQANILAEKLVKGLENESIYHYQSPFKRLTLSAGVACVSNNGVIYQHWEETVEQADQALYLAKTNGRNQTAIAPVEKYSLSANKLQGAPQ
ncbi:MAG: GGDEF domain-containing protein [Pseudomonadales bacterium]|nr:GGDEF domain-containing protein [Pseudomonadales bacterium]